SWIFWGILGNLDGHPLEALVAGDWIISSGGVGTVYDNCLYFAGAAAAEGRGAVIVVRGKAGYRLFKCREFDHHEAMKLLRSLHDLMASAARQDPAPVSGENIRNQIGIFLVFNRIVDLCARHPIGRHGRFPPTCPRNALAFSASSQYATKVQGER